MSHQYTNRLSCHRSLCSRANDSQSNNIIRARRQYLYDGKGNEYLDCINAVSHVGHSHPMVVQGIHKQMQLGDNLPNVFKFSKTGAYEKMILDRLPSHIDSLIFCTSGTEAVDLAISLAQAHTKSKHVICLEHSFHGSTESVAAFSSKIHSSSDDKPNWVSVVSLPRNDKIMCKLHQMNNKQTYPNIQTVLSNIAKDSDKIACFISEPIQGLNGGIPSKLWLQETYELVHKRDGLCIADEVQTGLGRLGTHFWAFETQEVVPDIVIIGKSIGNGYPMAAVATSKDILVSIGKHIENYKRSPVAVAAGYGVLTTMEQENLMDSAASVGKLLKDLLLNLQLKYNAIANVWGRGLLLTVEITAENGCHKTSKELTQTIISRLNSERISLAGEGYWENIIIIMPPLSFKENDAISLAKKFDQVMGSLGDATYEQEKESPPSNRRKSCLVPRVGICQLPQWDSGDKEGSPPSDSESYARLD